jgi:transposase-like protein
MAFKRQVVAELESGRFRSLQEAGSHYGIGGSQTVRQWLQRFGKNHLIPKVVRVEKPDEASELRELKQENRRLREALGEAHLKSVLDASFLKIACRRLGEDAESFKKKHDTRRSSTPTKKPKHP